MRTAHRRLSAARVSPSKSESLAGGASRRAHTPVDNPHDADVLDSRIKSKVKLMDYIRPLGGYSSWRLASLNANWVDYEEGVHGIVKSWQERVTLFWPHFSGIHGRMSRCPSEHARKGIGRHTTKRSRSTSITSLYFRLFCCRSIYSITLA